MTMTQVYEKYKHLDGPLSDREWLPDDLVGQILFELWAAARDGEGEMEIVQRCAVCRAKIEAVNV